MEVASAAEQAGFETLWVREPPLGDPPLAAPPLGETNDREDSLEPFTLLGALAVRTTRIALGVVAPVEQVGSPALLAKMATTVDVLSSGRSRVCLAFSPASAPARQRPKRAVIERSKGRGEAVWGQNGPRSVMQHRSVGRKSVGRKSVGTKSLGTKSLERLEETLLVCKAVLEGGAPSFEGQYFKLRGATNLPGPVQPGGIPLQILLKLARPGPLAGSVPLTAIDPAIEQALFLAARYASSCVLEGDELALGMSLASLDKACSLLGRDPSSLRRLAVVEPGHLRTNLDAASQRSTSHTGSNRAPCGLTMSSSLLKGIDGLVLMAPKTYELSWLVAAGEILSGALRASRHCR